jgi:Na+/H+ antiporter NhaA
MNKKKDFKTVTSNSFIVSVCILGLFAFAVTGCDYKSSNTSSLLGKAILNFQRGLNSVRTVGITVTCDTDTPAISTKKISGKH